MAVTIWVPPRRVTPLGVALAVVEAVFSAMTTVLFPEPATAKSSVPSAMKSAATRPARLEGPAGI